MLFPGRSPGRNGRLRLAGVEQPIEILTDDQGVPHIYAGCEKDLYFAQGYVHARERLWQMELNRRIARGRLAEIFGPDALAADRFMRTLGLANLAERHYPVLGDRMRSVLEAYAQGVNAGMKGLRPVEFLLLGIKSDPWSPLDSLLWSKVMAFDMGSNWENELMRGRLINRLGPELAARFQQRYGRDLPAAMGGKLEHALEHFTASYEEAVPWLAQGFGRFVGSNSWAVGPQRSQSGKAMLAADPHVLVRLPSTWFEVHLETDDGWAYGVSPVGMPGVILGQNEHVAWGITNSYVDTQDLCIEEFGPGLVNTAAGFVPIEVRQETFRIKKRPSITEEVWTTPNGPVMYQLEKEQGLALRWIGYQYEHDRTMEAILELNRARDAQQVREALSLWTCPCMNFVYATAGGDIGYQLAGRVPVRAKGIGLTPVPGADPRYAWTGTIPFEELPHVQNPECGYVVSANNAPVGNDYRYFLSVDWMGGFRAQRIEQLLDARRDHTLEDFARYQTDVLCLPGLRFSALCRRWLGAEAAELMEWDGQCGPDSRGAALYEVMLLKVCEGAFASRLGTDLLQLWLAGTHSPIAVMGPHGGRYVSFVLEAAENEDDGVLADGKTWPDVFREAWKKTVQEVNGRRWGELHQFELQHPLGAVKALRSYFNSKPVPFGGDTDTVMQSAVIPHKPYGAEAWAPSWRFMVDFARPEQGMSVLPSGQSGWPRDRHYLDQLELWLRGKLHPSLVHRGRLEATRPERLVLLPI